MRTVSVELPTHRYPIHIGLAALAALPKMLGDSSSIAIIVDDAVLSSVGEAAAALARQVCSKVALFPLRSSEDAKSISTAEGVLRAMADTGHDRRCCVVAIGGGIVGDIGGFVAATYMRGLAWLQVPTTLLAMVDASVGGKTGVNLRMENGRLAKNMVGAFWQPRGVIADVSFLSTLPSRQISCGLAECVKHSMIADASLMQWISENSRSILAADPDILEVLVARNVAIKAAIVAQDETEQGSRALLNLGHTFGHAIESVWSAEVLHGEAVSIGLVAASAAAVSAGLREAECLDPLRSLLESLGLPTRLPRTIRARVLSNAMGLDKKRRGGSITLILPDGDGHARVVTQADFKNINAGWAAVGAEVD